MNLLFIFVAILSASPAFGDDEHARAVDGPDTVRNKLYPREKRWDLALFDYGAIFTNPLVKTHLLHGGVSYYWSEQHAVNLEYAYGINEDKPERECLETFYNHAERDSETAGDCDAAGGKLSSSGQSNYGPAYMAIREINHLAAINFIWNPIYGKQLFLRAETLSFDILTTIGVGLAQSTYYPMSEELRNGQKSRGSFNEDTGKMDGGAQANEQQLVGEAGRPDPREEVHPYLNLGLGQKFNFLRRWSVKVELRSMTLLGTPKGFENYLSLWSGIGVKI